MFDAAQSPCGAGVTSSSPSGPLRRISSQRGAYPSGDDVGVEEGTIGQSNGVQLSTGPVHISWKE